MPATSRLLGFLWLAASACSDDASGSSAEASVPGDLTGPWRVVAIDAEETQGLELVHDLQTDKVTGTFCTPDDTWSCGEEQIAGEVVGRRLTLSWMLRIQGELRNETLTAELSSDGNSFSGKLIQRVDSGKLNEFAVAGSRG